MAEFAHKVDIIKIDEDEHKVFGIFSVSKMNGEFLVDKQDDVIKSETLEKAAHNFVLNARIAGANHSEMGVGSLIESMVFTEEKMAILEETLKSFGVKDPIIKANAEFWFGGFKIHSEEVWKAIKSGDFESFSIGAVCDRAPM